MTREARYLDRDPRKLHELYGVNCYQKAIGYKPVTIHFNQTTGHLNYLTLCPGNMAEIIHNQGTRNYIQAKQVKKFVIDGCKMDGLEELEARSLNDGINIPADKKLIAMFFSNQDKDFDFHVYDKKSNSWKNKTPMGDVTETNELPQFLENGGYMLTRLFCASGDVVPRGVPAGKHLSYPDTNIILNAPDSIAEWEFGPCLKRVEGGFMMAGKQDIYSPPDLSLFKG